MVTTIDAVFDGISLRPEKPLALEPNTRVRITIDSGDTVPKKAVSFLDTAESLNLDGPSDWSKNLDKYLYGGKEAHDE